MTDDAPTEDTEALAEWRADFEDQLERLQRQYTNLKGRVTRLERLALLEESGTSALRLDDDD